MTANNNDAHTACALSDAELEAATGGVIPPPNNSTKLPMPHGPIGPGPTTGPFWPQPKTM